MEDILVERFTYAKIESYKDYCNINDEIRLKRTSRDWEEENSEDDFYGNFLNKIGRSRNEKEQVNSKNFKGVLKTLPEKKRNKRKKL